MGWVLWLAKSKIVDHYRAQGRRKVVFSGTLLDQMAAGDLRWRTVSQTPETGEIVVATWSPANPKVTRRRVLRLDRARTTYLELLPAERSERIVQRWTYVNDRSSP